ncbi:MAG: hypothetical protein IJN18_03740 [Clostridia bacterium]|nr:hypothetical protein [Clostridia bacterium]MBR6573440.1 hypothetical protein [Clostridia bacterium]
MSEAAVLRSTMTDRATITREAWNGTAWERVVAYEGLPCALSRAPQTPTASITGLWEEVPECQGQMSLFVPRDTVLQAGDRAEIRREGQVLLGICSAALPYPSHGVARFFLTEVKAA